MLLTARIWVSSVFRLSMKNYDIATRTIHAGQEPDPSTGAIMTPIYATSTYVQESPGKHKGFDYSRSINPTRLAYEKCIADLESGTRGWAFASGLAAMATALDALDSGSHVVASDDLYGGTFRLFEKVRRRSANLDFTFVDLTDASKFEKSIKPNTRMVWIETPSNPLLKIIDIEAIAKIAREKKIISVSDNTFATPWIQRPIEAGFDMVIHSATKYLNGHSDMVGGVIVVGENKELADQIAFLQNSVGAIAGPFDSFLALRGLKTLALRMERHCSNALGNRALARRPTAGEISLLSRAQNPSAARSRAPANARVRRNRHDYLENRSRRNAALSREHSFVCPGRKFGRGREPDRSSRYHDACLGSERSARKAWNHRFTGAFVGRGGRRARFN